MTTTPAVPVPEISPVDAAGQAFEHARRRLFPFRFERWLALGFVAFLDQCGRQGGGFNFPNVNVPFGGGGGGGRPDFSRAADWIGAHVVLLVVISAVILTLVVAITALVLWLNSRGVFMYIDNVATGRSDVGRPWREHAEAAGSLFAWRFGLSVVTLAVMVLLLATAVAVILGGLRRGFALGTILTLVGLLLTFLFVALLVALATFALRDFVAPLQIRTGRPCGEAIGLFWRLLKAHPGAFVVYLLLRIVFGIALGIVMLIVGCMTCCIGFLPVVAQTLFQPAFYFERAWSLYLLRQLGYDLIVETPAITSGPPLEALT